MPSKKSTPKKTRGRAPFKPTDTDKSLVTTLAGCGIPHKHICALVRDGIDLKTLYKYFARELELGKAKANAKVGQVLYQKAIGGDLSAAIFWAKTQMQWSERVQVEHGGLEDENGALTPIRIEIVKTKKGNPYGE